MAISKNMEIAEERVALRGEEVMKDIIFMNHDNIARDSLMVTPLGICYSYYEEANNFVFVSFNGQQTKIYDNGRLQIVDAAMQAAFANEDLFPKRGPELKFVVNGEERTVRGEPGEAAVILLNGAPANIHSKIHGNDIIEVTSSTEGAAGAAEIASLPEFKASFPVVVNGKNVMASRFATVNDQSQTGFYQIQNGDEVRVLDYDTAAQIAQLMDVELTPDIVITVNNEMATPETPVYENFKVEFKKQEDAIMDYYRDFPDADNPEPEEDPEEEAAPAPVEPPVKRVIPKAMHVTANGEDILLQGKSEYVFVDVFDYLDFDLSNPGGKSIVTLLNGQSPNYMQQLQEGDRIEVYWKDIR